MATTSWLGGAPVVQEVYTLVPGGTIESTDVWNVTIGNQTVSTVGGSTVAATVATAIEAACDAFTSELFDENTWSVNSATITVTGPDDGRPVTITGTTTETGGGAADAQTFTITNTVEAEGPNDWSTVENWSGAAVPGADTVWLLNSDVSILYGLNQTAVTITALNVEASFTGYLGLPEYSEVADYPEYRTTYLTANITTLNIGRGEGDGSKRIKINTQSDASTIHVWKTGGRVDNAIPSFLWKGANASNVMTVHRGDVGIAILPGETATLPTLNVGYLDNVDGDSQVMIGAGATITTINQNGGVITSFATATITTVKTLAGTFFGYGGTITTLTIDGGKYVHMGTGTITTLTINTDGEFDADQSDGAFTVTNTIVMRAGSKLKNRKRRINSGSNPVIQLAGCGLKDVEIDLGDNVTMTVAYN